MENNVGSNPKQLQLPMQSQELFTEGICLILSKWSALQMAVENEWGGRNSRAIADQLGSDVFSWFTRSKEPLYIDDLEDMLDEALLSLNTMAEDGSVQEVAEKLMVMHEECLEGNFKSIEKLRETPTIARPPVRQILTDEEDNEEEDDSMQSDNSSDMKVDLPGSGSNLDSSVMAVEETRPNPVAESDDGWVVVGSRRNKGRRN